jgi:hypothetical protein
MELPPPPQYSSFSNRGGGGGQRSELAITWSDFIKPKFVCVFSPILGLIGLSYFFIL